MEIPKSKVFIWVPLLVVVLLSSVAFFVTTVFHPYRIIGSSMEPTLHHGQFVILMKSPVKVGALAVLEAPEGWAETEDTLIMKRIAAMPGDEITFDDAGLKVNDVRIVESGRCSPNSFKKVLDNEVLLLGDNRKNSSDSMQAWCTGRDFLIPVSSLKFVGRSIL